MQRTLFALVSLVALAGCSSKSDDTENTNPSGDKKLVFHATPEATGASISLRQKELTNGHLVVELVGHALPDVYGVAFRLKYDPAVLGLEKVEAGSVWAGAPIALGTEKVPGVLAGVVSKQGAVAGIAGSDQVLATVSLTLKQKAATGIEFIPHRNHVVDAAGKSASSTFTGGALALE
jgi:hypothetical protein